MFVDHRDRVETLWGTRAVTSLHWRGESEKNMHSLIFMLNCYYCLCGTMSHFFGQIPPMLDENLPIDEVLLCPPAVN